MNPIPLWAPSSRSIYSSAFNISSGEVCVLYAHGLTGDNHVTNPTQVRTPRTVCIHRMLFGYTRPETPDGCGWVFDIGSVKVDTLVDTLVQTCGLPWQLTACRNIGIIGLPGTYRLQLSDSTVVGVAQVYAELYPANSIPVQVQNLFF